MSRHLTINPIGRGLAKKMPGRIGVRTRQKELVHDKDKCSAVGRPQALS
jgi:hypothetical protein